MDMQLAVSSYSYSRLVSTGALKAGDVMKKAKEMGFSGIEYAGLWVPEGMTPVAYAKELAAEAQALGMTITGYSVGGNFLCADPEAEAERLKKEVDVAYALGAKRMRHDICYGPLPGGYRSFEKNLPILIKGARSVTEYAKELGIQTMVENHGFFCQDSHRVEMLIDGVNSDNYGALIDLGNFLCADEDPGRAVGVLKSYAFSVHCKDFYYHDGETEPKGSNWIFTRGGNYIKGAAVGDGIVPVAKCLRILRASGYDGPVAIEYEGAEDPIASIAAGRDYVQRLIG